MDNAIRRLCVDTCVPFSARGVSVLLRQPVFWRSARARQMCAVSSSGGGVSIGFGQASASLRWLCTGRSSPGWIRRAVDIDLVLDHQRNMLYYSAFGDSGVPGESVLVQERESAEDRCRVELSGDLVAFFVAAQPVERCRDRRREFLDELLAPLRELRNTLRLGEHDLSVATILCDVVGEGADDVPNQIVWLRRGGV